MYASHMSRAPSPARPHAVTRTLAAVGAGALVLYGSRVLLNFLGPNMAYGIQHPPAAPLDSDEFLRFLTAVTHGHSQGAQVARLRNGQQFYPAELDAIRQARHAVNLEFYEFSPGRVADEMLAALCERARAGVAVRLVLDRLGSFRTPTSYFDGLRAAGGQMQWYHPLRWNTWQHADQRTHRKLLIVDGRVGFIGGAGIADHWLHATSAGPAWRDTVFRVEGGPVADLVSTFSENWLESSGEILSGEGQFEVDSLPDAAPAFVVASTPNGGGTTARILFQSLIACARHTIRITTPYFLPDRSARAALIDAVQQRGMRVQILTAGPHIDHPSIRWLSLQSSRQLLDAGAEIYEYNPAMIHAKLLTVDGQWSVVGSTNFDHRSFALNDEVNLAVLDPELVSVIESDFLEDLRSSSRLTPSMLQERLLLGRWARPLIHGFKQGT